MPQEKLPQILKKFRQKYGLKQESLAEILNVQQSEISRWETGTSVPTSSNQDKICNLLDKFHANWIIKNFRFLDYSPTSIVIRDKEKIVYINPSASAALKVDASNLLGIKHSAFGLDYLDRLEAIFNTGLGEEWQGVVLSEFCGNLNVFGQHQTLNIASKTISLTLENGQQYYVCIASPGSKSVGPRLQILDKQEFEGTSCMLNIGG